MKALVTGATGFLGSRLASKLMQNGDQVRALVRIGRKVDALIDQGVDLAYGDLKDRDSLQRALEGVQVVYHAGAAMRGSWEEYRQSTVTGTTHMLELALQAGVACFVHISSIVVYQVYDLQRNAAIDEGCPLVERPETFGPYTRAKVAAEHLARRYAQQGLPLVVIRPGVIFGPGGKVLFPQIGYALRGKVFALIGKGDNLLPLTYLDNTVEAILLAAHTPAAVGQAYHIVDDTYITQREYLRHYMAATGERLRLLPVPIWLLKSLMACLEPLRRFDLPGVASLPSKYGFLSKWKSLRFNTAKAKAELGWSPKVALDEGLKSTFEDDNRRKTT